MGTSSRRISLLHRAAETSMIDGTNPLNLGLIMNNVIKMYFSASIRVLYSDTKWHRYQELQHDMTGFTTPNTPGQFTREMISCLDHIASAYKNVLITYIHIILDVVETNASTFELMLESLAIRSLLTMTKREAISACLRDIMSVPESSSCAVGLVPLLFVVATESRDRAECDAASQRLHDMLKTACLGNIASALELLKATQALNVADWRQILKGFGWDLIVT